MLDSHLSVHLELTSKPGDQKLLKDLCYILRDSLDIQGIVN